MGLPYFYRRSSPNGSQLNFAACWEVNQICKPMFKMWRSLANNWDQNCLFWTGFDNFIKSTSQLSRKYLEKETWERTTALGTARQKVSTFSQSFMNFNPQSGKNSTCILSTLQKFCILHLCQHLHMKVTERESIRTLLDDEG